MPWFSLIADGSRSCDRLPAISGEWTKPSSRASPSFRAWPTPPKGRSKLKAKTERNLGTGIDEDDDNYKNNNALRIGNSNCR